MAVQRSRADLVYTALESAGRTWRLGDVEVQVTQIDWDEAKNRVTVDARVIYQGELIADDRFHFVNPPTLVHDGTFGTRFKYTSRFDGDATWLTSEQRDRQTAAERRFWNPTGESQQYERSSLNPLLALQQSFIETARIVTKDWTRPRLERIGLSNRFRGDTLSVRSGTADGYASDSDPTWASTQNGPGEGSTTTGNIIVNATGSGTLLIRQCFLGWDTSSLDDAAVISNFNITLYADGFGVSDVDSATFELYIYDWGGTVETTDYRDCSPSTNITNLTKMASIALSSWTDTADSANDLTETTAYSSISKTGTTYMVGLFDLAYGSQPTGGNSFQFRSADEAGTTYDPLLVVTYTVPVTVSVTGVTAAAPAEGITGVVSTVRIANITGVTAAAPAEGIAGVVTAESGASVAVTGVTGAADAAGIAGVVSAVQIVAITGAAGAAPAEGIAGVVTAHIQIAVTGVTAAAAAAGEAGVVAAIRIANITGVTGDAPAAGIAGVVAAHIQVIITGVTAAANASGIAGVVAAQVQVTVTGVTGSAPAEGIAGVVTAVRIVTVIGVTGEAPATGIAGVVTAVRIVTVIGVTGEATADGAGGEATGVRLSVILMARYAPQAEFTARYAPQTEITARYAPQPEISGRYAPQSESEARYG